VKNDSPRLEERWLAQFSPFRQLLAFWKTVYQWYKNSSRYLDEGLSSTAHLPLQSRLLLELLLFGRMILRSDVTVRASSTAYSFVFAIVPLLASTLAFFTVLPGLNDQRQQLKTMLYNTLLPGAAREVQVYLEKFSEAAAAAGAVSSLFFLVTVLLLFRSLESTYNLIWRGSISRTWWQRMQILAVFFLTGAVGTTLLVLIGQEGARLAAQVGSFGKTSLYTLLAQTGYFVANVLVGWMIFFVATWVIPSTRVRPGAALTGAVVMGSIWLVLKSSFSWYIDNFGSYKTIYGAVGTVPVLLLWIYLTILLLLASAYLAFVHQNLRVLINNHHAEQRQNETASFHALMVVAGLADAFQQRKGPQSLIDLEEQLGLTDYILLQLLDKLELSQLVLRVAGEPPRWLLAAPAEKIRLSEVVVAAEGSRLQAPQKVASAEPSVTIPLPLVVKVTAVLSRARAELSSVLANTTVSDLVRLAPLEARTTGAEEGPVDGLA